MTERADPYEILHVIQPASDRGRLEPGQLPHADALLAQIVEGHAAVARRMQQSPWRRPRRPWAVAAGVVVASLVVTSAAAGLWWRSRSSDHRVLACYAAASPDADRYEMQIDAGDDPVAVCAVLWADGTITSGQANLQVCSTSTGTTAVVPGDDPSACVAAGLEPYDRTVGDGATLEQQQTVDRLAARLLESFLDVCLDEQASRAAAERVLRDEGLDDWSVVVTVPFSAQRSCGAADIDAAEQTIVIAAIPPAPTGGG